jgi:hypothetical protein
MPRSRKRRRHSPRFRMSARRHLTGVPRLGDSLFPPNARPDQSGSASPSTRCAIANAEFAAGTPQ